MSMLKEKVVLITGGGSGVGRTTALACCREGARVAVVDLARALAHGLRVLEGTWDVGRPWSRLWQRFVAFI